MSFANVMVDSVNDELDKELTVIGLGKVLSTSCFKWTYQTTAEMTKTSANRSYNYTNISFPVPFLRASKTSKNSISARSQELRPVDFDREFWDRERDSVIDLELVVRSNVSLFLNN